MSRKIFRFTVLAGPELSYSRKTTTTDRATVRRPSHATHMTHHGRAPLCATAPCNSAMAGMLLINLQHLPVHRHGLLPRMWFHLRPPDRAYALDAHSVEQRAHPLQRLRGALPRVSKVQKVRREKPDAAPAAVHRTEQPASSLKLLDGVVDEQPRPQRLKLPRRIEQR